MDQEFRLCYQEAFCMDFVADSLMQDRAGRAQSSKAILDGVAESSKIGPS